MRALVLAAVALSSGCVELSPLFTALDAGADGGVADGGTDAGTAFIADQITAADAHACAIRAGALFCWGKNADGQLGTGDVQPRTSPTRVGADTDWVEVHAGYTSTCARKTNGTVWCWGSNDEGELGRGVAGGLRVPTQVTLGFAAQQVALHFDHVCALAQNGELWCWGQNTEGELGLNDAFTNGNQLSPQQVAPGTLWKQVDTGQGHTCAIQQDGSLWCWGRNSGGHLGLPQGAAQQLRSPQHIGTDTDWQHVVPTQNGTCATKNGHTLYCWGYTYEQAIDANTIVYGPKQIDTGVDEIAMETFSICTRDASNSVSCWGRNDEGQLGSSDNASYYTPKVVDTTAWSSNAMGRMFRCAIKAGGGVACTGANSDGQLGTGDTNRRNVMTPVTLP